MPAVSRTDPIRPLDLPQYAYEHLREAILTGNIAQGTQLKEQTLATELGISRTPVREALRRLAAEGFAESSPRYGVFVRQLDEASLAHLREVRCALESGAALLLAQKPHRGKLDGLAQQAKAVDEAHAKYDLKPLYELELRFHRSILEAVGNPELLRVAANLQVVFFTFQDAVENDEAAASEKRNLRHWVTHSSIVEAIAGRKKDEAYKMMWEHVSRSRMDQEPE